MTAEELHKARRASAGALLLAGHRARQLMTRGVDDAIAGAAHELRQRRADEKRALVLLVLLAAGKRMTAGLAVAIEAGRRQARGLAAQRLGAELRAAGVSREGSVGLLAGLHIDRMGADAVEATIAAESLAGQWRALASRAVLQAQRLGEDVPAAVSASREPMQAKIARTAETEAARAYNDEHLERARDMLAAGDLPPGALLREWSALIDACEACWPHDGERTGIDESFSGGEEPGSVHPRCRCSDIIVAA